MRVGKCIPTLEDFNNAMHGRALPSGNKLSVIAVSWWATIIIIIATRRLKCWLTVYVQRKGFPVKFFGLSVIRRNYNHTLFSIFKWKGINFWKTPYIQNYTVYLIDFCSECRYTYGQPVKGKVFVSFAVKRSRRARERQTTVVDEVILIDSMKDKMNFRIQILAFMLSVLWKLACYISLYGCL